MPEPDTLIAQEKIPYGPKRVEIASGGREIFVISDLHMAAGLNINQNYDGTENFFADRSLFRFLQHIRQRIPAGKKGLLIINGDFVDFLRIRNIPVTESELSHWRKVLLDIGMEKSLDDLRGSISKKERKYGLGTEDYKSVWKLAVCAKGHRIAFEGLAAWLWEGHEIIITKGNHDLEWYWPAVRNYLRLIFSELIAQGSNQDRMEMLEKVVGQQTHFIDDTLVIDQKIYIEHGHRYENFTSVDGPPVLQNKTQLNLPFGSFFNRYLINRIELAYPYIDDVRPRKNILPVLIRERFPLALKLLFNYIPFTFLVIPKKQYGYALRYLFHFLLIIGIPLAITAAALIRGFPHPVPGHSSNSSPILQSLMSELKNLLLLVLSYVIGRLFAMWRLSAPSTLFPNAQQIFSANPQVELVTFGHTHDPEQLNGGTAGRRYCNTGTWIPVYEIDAADVRLDRTYTFIHVRKDENGGLLPTELYRWNDEAQREDLLVLMDKK